MADFFEQYTLKDRPEDLEKFMPGLPAPFTQQERMGLYNTLKGQERPYEAPPEPTKTDYNVVPPSQSGTMIQGFSMSGMGPLRFAPSKYDVQRSVNRQMRYQETEQKNREMMDTGGETYDQRNARLFQTSQAQKAWTETQRNRTKELIESMIKARNEASKRAENYALWPYQVMFGGR